MPRLCLLLALGLIWLAEPVTGQVIPLANPGFEADPLWDGQAITSCSGWTNFNSGTLNPTQGQYPLEAPEGQNVAWADNIGWVSQTAPGSMSTGHTYILKVDVGRRLDTGWPGYRIRLIAGHVGVVLATDENGVTPAPGQFLTTTLSYETRVGFDGLPLVIMLYSYGVQVNFDNVRLVEATDFGDAPDSFGTLLASDGARHPIVAGYRLGSEIDHELDGQPTAGAGGDDGAPVPDDEDGVVWPDTLLVGEQTAITVTAGDDGGVLNAWIDFNRNGVFDHPSEHVFDGVGEFLVAGANPLVITVPGDASPGDTYARFRLSSAGALPPTGEAPNGEVEDYAVVIDDNQVGVGDLGGHRTRLLQNAPNPFTRSSLIQYELGEPGEVRIRVYDALGRLVRELQADHAQPGRYDLRWPEFDSRGRPLPPGIYFYRMTGPEFMQTRRAVKIR